MTSSIRNVIFDMGGVLMTFDSKRFATIFTDTEEDAELLDRRIGVDPRQCLLVLLARKLSHLHLATLRSPVRLLPIILTQPSRPGVPGGPTPRNPQRPPPAPGPA